VTRNPVTDIGAFQTQKVVSLSLGAPKKATAGSSFSVTITLLDRYGHPVLGYTGDVTLAFTSSDNQTVNLASASVSLANGVGTATITLATADTVKLTASVVAYTDDAMTIWPGPSPMTAGMVKGTSNSITVAA
jgi:hypothetical protein